MDLVTIGPKGEIGNGQAHPSRCDVCGTDGYSPDGEPPKGWFFLELTDDEDVLFCSWACLAGFAAECAHQQWHG
jgi:hypothetical protein